MPDWVEGLLGDLFYGPFFVNARAMWNWCMGLCTGLMTKSPQAFSSETWEFVTETLYPWSLGIGVACLNLFFIIGFVKAVSNFKENITLELCIESMIRLVVANVLMQTGLTIIQAFFTMASRLAGQVMWLEEIPMYTTENDIGTHLFWWLFGFLYFIVALVCAFIIFLTLYGRYIKLYLLVVFYPVAVPAFIAGRGVESATYAWLKSFLSNVFEVVVIALVMSIAGRLISEINVSSGFITQFFDGFEQALNSLVHIILMTASVKGASSFLNKSFAL